MRSKESIRGFLGLLPAWTPRPDSIPRKRLPIESLCEPLPDNGDEYATRPQWEPLDTRTIPLPPDGVCLGDNYNWCMAAAVEEWERLSNGRIEAREVLFPFQRQPQSITIEFIASLGFACLNRYSETEDSQHSQLRVQFTPIHSSP